MMTATFRRNFPAEVKLAIMRRSADGGGRMRCERCGVWCKSPRDFEVDHILAEGVRPEADKRRELTPADGQLLCLDCHKRKTGADVGSIAEAKRREASHWGAKSRPKKERPPLTKIAVGEPQIARQYRRRNDVES